MRRRMMREKESGKEIRDVVVQGCSPGARVPFSHEIEIFQ